MKGIPLIDTQNPRLIVRGFELGNKLASNVVKVFTEEDLVYYEANLPKLKDILRQARLPEKERPEDVVEYPLPILTLIDPTFGYWLTAREELHKFFTRKVVNLQEMFAVSDELLARTDIMPVFRPVGASNRDAIGWKKKLSIDVLPKKPGVMKYKNSEGPQVPELYFINRSVRPDANTLGKKAKSPNQLIEVKLEKGTQWLNLFGFADADNLHFLITGEHLDSGDTLTWFPEDRLPDGGVAHGGWSPGRRQVGFLWDGADNCHPDVGARLATQIPLRTK